MHLVPGGEGSLSSGSAEGGGGTNSGTLPGTAPTSSAGGGGNLIGSSGTHHSATSGSVHMSFSREKDLGDLIKRPVAKQV